MLCVMLFESCWGVLITDRQTNKQTLVVVESLSRLKNVFFALQLFSINLIWNIGAWLASVCYKTLCKANFRLCLTNKQLFANIDYECKTLGINFKCFSNLKV